MAFDETLREGHPAATSWRSVWTVRSTSEALCGRCSARVRRPLGRAPYKSKKAAALPA